MAGKGKKKKPASNPARGFATTSIASKPKAEALDVEQDPVPTEELSNTPKNQQGDLSGPVALNGEPTLPEKTLTPEEFEKQLEESELQVLVEKYAQKSKRDALRQKTRLETERRVLRTQAENLNARKWLPPELMEEILDLIKEEGRFSGQAADASNMSKQSLEEDLAIRLWTLQQTLVGAGFLRDKVILALQHVLDISDKIGTSNKDTIWGLEESLDWFARECSREELPDYESWQRKPGSFPKSRTGKCNSFPMFLPDLTLPTLDTPNDSPLASGTSTPRFESDTRHVGLGLSVAGNATQVEKRHESPKKAIAMDYDSDIDPDELLPVYLETKSKLFHLKPLVIREAPSRSNSKKPAQKSPSNQPTTDPKTAKLLRKIRKIEDDVLFDRYLADQQWEARRIQLEREAAARRNAAEIATDSNDPQGSETLVDSDDEVSREAAKIGAALLEETSSDDDAALADLFASLPVNEVDPLTGKSSTVVNGTNGIKVTIRNFGKWTGVSPPRVLEEACRARSVFEHNHKTPERILLTVDQGLVRQTFL